MAGSCCAQPTTRIIRVAEFEAGIIGLDRALQNVYVSGLKSEAAIESDLLQWIKTFGNYVSPSREADYGRALLREYRAYVLKQK